MSTHRNVGEWPKAKVVTKPTWGEILLTKQTLTVSKILIGFAISYVLGGIWYGMIELKSKIFR